MSWPAQRPGCQPHHDANGHAAGSWLRPVFLRTSSISSADGPGHGRLSHRLLLCGPQVQCPQGLQLIRDRGWGYAPPLPPLPPPLGAPGLAPCREELSLGHSDAQHASAGHRWGVGEQLGPGSDKLEPVYSVSREVLMEPPLDTELPPEGRGVAAAYEQREMLCWGSPLGTPIPPSPEPPAIQLHIFHPQAGAPFCSDIGTAAVLGCPQLPIPPSHHSPKRSGRHGLGASR